MCVREERENCRVEGICQGAGLPGQPEFMLILGRKQKAGASFPGWVSSAVQHGRCWASAALAQPSTAHLPRACLSLLVGCFISGQSMAGCEWECVHVYMAFLDQRMLRRSC